MRKRKAIPSEMILQEEVKSAFFENRGLEDSPIIGKRISGLQFPSSGTIQESDVLMILSENSKKIGSVSKSGRDS